MSGKTAKAHRRRTINLVAITVTTEEEGGKFVNQVLDVRKVDLVDRATGKPLFNPVKEQ